VYARSLISGLRAAKRSFCLLFSDVQSAYYQTCRQLLIGSTSTDSLLISVLERRGLQPAVTALPLAKFRGEPLLDVADLPELVLRALQDLLQATWQKVKGCGLLTHAVLGTRPGDPLADALFSAILASFLHEATTELLTHGLLPQVALEWPLERNPPLEAGWTGTAGADTWADDVAIPVCAASASALQPALSQTVEILTRQAAAHGLTFVFDRRKSAALGFPAGPGAAQALVPDAEQRIRVPFMSPTGEPGSVEIVPAYSHLGVLIDGARAPRQEIRLRAGQVSGVLREFANKLFANPRFPLGLRAHLLQSLVVSKLCYGAGVLPLHHRAATGAWHRAYLRIARAALADRTSDPVFRHHTALLGCLNWPSPPMKLALLRASVLERLVLYAPACLWAVLQQEYAATKASWGALVDLDIRLVAGILHSGEVPGTFPVLSQAVAQQPGLWVRLVKAARRRQQSSFEAHTPALRLRQQAQIAARRAGLRELVAQPVLDFACCLCLATFVTRKALAVHLAKVHQQFRPARHFAHGTRCRACLKQYHTRTRLVEHLRRVPRCLNLLVLVYPPLSIAEVQDLDSAEILRRKAAQKVPWKQQLLPRPVTQLAGPRPFHSTWQPAVARQHIVEHQEPTAASTFSVEAELARLRHKDCAVQWCFAGIWEGPRPPGRAVCLTAAYPAGAPCPPEVRRLCDQGSPFCQPLLESLLEDLTLDTCPRVCLYVGSVPPRDPADSQRLHQLLQLTAFLALAGDLCIWAWVDEAAWSQELRTEWQLLLWAHPHRAGLFAWPTIPESECQERANTKQGGTAAGKSGENEGRGGNRSATADAPEA
jgi:hypothetical protein